MEDPKAFFDAIGGPACPSSYPTPSKVKHEARANSRDIFDSWTTLYAILERHEAVIRRRWAKKSQEQRKKILLSAWPNMSSNHRPDYKALQKETPKERARGTKYSDAYLWPYINIEDLIQGKSLLLFLNSRGRNQPEAFSNADLEAAHVGVVSTAIQRPFLNGHTMLLHGQLSCETYGKLVSWDDDENAFDWMNTGHGKQPHDGLLILNIQKGVLSFLVKCCRLILADMPPRLLTDKDTPVQPDPGPIMPDSTAWPSLAALSSEAPYRVPARVDFQRLQAIIAANFSAAKDHVWSLREDPDYFTSILRTHGEHRTETLLDVNGKKHPELYTKIFWDFVLGNMVIDADRALYTWEGLYNQVTLLVTLKEKHGQTIALEQTLPSEYWDAVLLFKYLLDRAVEAPIDDLKMIVPPSPPLRSLFVREPQDPNTTIMKIKIKAKNITSKYFLILSTLWDRDQLMLHRLPNLMDELDLTLRTDLTQKNLVSPFVAETISDLAVLVESLRQLGLLQPWASSLDFETTDDRDDFQAFYTSRMSRNTKFKQAMKGVSLADLGTPSRDLFRYPADKRRTRENVEAMRVAERNLDALWHRIDSEVVRRDNTLQGFGMPYIVTQGRQLQRTPEWVEPLQEEPAAKVTESTEASHNAFAQLHLRDDASTSSVVWEEKIKLKTRGSARPTPRAGVAAAELPARQVDAQTTLAVSKRALKVFSILFYTPTAQTENPGEVPWPDFLHAMASARFVVEKLYGSVWQFTPTKLDVERSIQFHEPHPQGKIPFTVAKRHGRRLNRAYGWTGETFVQVDKET